jgi:hypothetical protein
VVTLFYALHKDGISSEFLAEMFSHTACRKKVSGQYESKNGAVAWKVHKIL